MNPLSGILEVNFGPNQGLEEADGLAILTNLAALAHERHHWLQLIGTTAGQFTTVLLETQTAIWAGANRASIKAGDLPLLDVKPVGPEVQAWAEIECWRLFSNGARNGDISTLWSSGFIPDFHRMASMMQSVVSQLFAGTGAESIIKLIWDVDPPPLAPLGDIEVVGEGPWVLGTRHLMECGAAITEKFKLMLDIEEATERGASDVPLHPPGVYSVARNAFYREIGEPTVGVTG